MCGIIGYIGKKSLEKVLIEGLKNLEYRGYDSSGIALQNFNDVQIIKSTGKIKELEKKLQEINLINSNIGIAHTRWATHGNPNIENAHPHQVGNITLVHNGIIENANELRQKLTKEGVKFKSQTDTEVLCALINFYYKNDISSAIKKALKEVKGSYALAILVKKDESIYAIKKDSPLIVGIDKDGYFIASDISAIIKYTNKYIVLEENELVKLSQNDYVITKNNKIIKKSIQSTEIDFESITKSNYKHYMLKEIMEEEILLEKTFNIYNDKDSLIDISKYEEIHIIGCGSAMYAGMVGKTLLEEKSNIRCYVECASEYRYKKIFYDRKTLVILISQSGETADTIAAMRKAKENKIDTLAIVNVKTSTIARESDYKIFIEAGKEIAVATTKAYLLQVTIFSLLAYFSSINKHILKEINLKEEEKNILRHLKNILEQRKKYYEIAKKIFQEEDIYFIGRGIDYSLCLEGSLKLKEISYIHSEAYQAGELKHGTIALINKNTPVIAIISDQNIADKTLSNIEEVKSRGANVIIISTKKISNSENNIVVPKISDFFQPILIIPILQLIAYEVANLRNCDIDKPKNLAKSVTVE
ncbi:MAG: glutamine--fructose-6-phosphate transaminase (isomerizing) [Bacilli bacterium]|nr:glutamine--fructose-6-phosphate transaminase (isomerizing) [Bacilli bacterium]